MVMYFSRLAAITDMLWYKISVERNSLEISKLLVFWNKDEK